jgi:hypothetical protein
MKVSHALLNLTTVVKTLVNCSVKPSSLIITVLISLASFTEVAQADDCRIVLYLANNRPCVDPSGTRVAVTTNMYNVNANTYLYKADFSDTPYDAISKQDPIRCIARARDWLEYCGGKSGVYKKSGEISQAYYKRAGVPQILGSYTYGSPVYKYIYGENLSWIYLP